MKFNFAEVDGHGQTLGSIVAKMETSVADLKRLQGELTTVLEGQGASGFQNIMSSFNAQLNNYQTALGVVKVKIADTAGSAGLMQVTDANNGKLFYSV